MKPDSTHFATLLHRLQEIAATVIVHFIRLVHQGKEPIELWKLPKSWMDSELATSRLSTGLNVGIVAQPDGLAFIDIDVEGGSTKLPEEQVKTLIETMDTFTVKTANGGYHLIFINGGIVINSLLKYSGKTIGELRANMQYIVAAGSYVPPKAGKATPDATGIYTVIRDVPLKTLQLGDIPSWLELGKEQNDVNVVKMFKMAKDTIAAVFLGGHSSTPVVADSIKNESGMTLEQVRTGDSDDCKELNEYLKGAEHKLWNDSRSEADFHTAIILAKNGFSAPDIAQILRQYRPYDKTMRDNYLISTIAKAIARVKMDSPSNLNLPLTSIESLPIETLPDELPNKKYVLIKGNPRIGKTRWAVQQLLKAPNGIYVSHRHTITRHAIEEFRTQNPKRTAVLLMGKDASCNREDGEKGRCADCPKRLVAEDQVVEGDGISITQYFREALTLLRENPVLTDQEISQHLCPHFALKFAEPYADYCFTVPFFYANEDTTVLIKPRSLVVLDEDPVVDYFYPTTIELAEYIGKEGKIRSANNILSDYLPPLDELEKHISALGHKYAADRRILDIIRVIRDKFNPVIAGLVDIHSKEYKDGVIDKLNAINIPIFNDDERRTILKRVKRHLKELPGSFKVNVDELFESFLFPAQKKYIWIGDNPNTLYLVGDRTIIRPPIAKQLVIIGATNSELFLEQLCAGSPQDAGILDITAFPYRDNFTVFRLNGDTKKHEDRMILRFIRLIVERNRKRDDKAPCLILTNSKKSQEHLWDRHPSASIGSRDETEEDQISNWRTGKLNIFYTNSTLSRGLNVPYYDLLLVDSCNYVIPFWTSEIQRAKESGDQRAIMRSRMIYSRLISDELTNSVLRHSPVHGIREEQAKFIVVKSGDFGKISDKVTNGMYVVEINNNEELRKVAAAVTEMVTRESQSASREKVGFFTVFPLPVFVNRASTSPKTIIVAKDTAIVLGKTREEVRLIFKNGIAAVTIRPSPPHDNHYRDLCGKIKKYPSFLRGCRAQRHAIVKWMRKRYPTISEQRIKSTLQMMAIEGILVQSTDKHGKINYSIRKCNDGERGTDGKNPATPSISGCAHA